MTRESATYWADYPATTSLITAAALNNIEAALDSKVGPGNTSPPLCEAKLTTAYTGLAAGDYLLSGNFTVTTDPYSMFSSAFSFYRIIVPIAGRWHIDWAWNATGQGTVELGGRVCLNVPNGTSSLTADTTYALLGGGATNGIALVRMSQSVVLAAGDQLSWSVSSAGTFTMPVALFGGIATKIVVRWLGPN